MSTGDFRVDPAQIKASIPTFTAEAERLRVAAAAFRAELAGFGAPWGNDENGREFGKTFVTNQDEVMRAADVLAQGMGSIGPTLQALADNAESADQTNSEKLS